MINEIIIEEEEDKNNKEKDKDKNIIKNNNNNNKNKPSLISNNNENNVQNLANSPKSNCSPYSKKTKTHENLLYKKTYDKYISVRDKLVPETINENKMKNLNKNIILPDLKNFNNNNNYLSLSVKKSCNSQKINLRNLSVDKTKPQQSINLNSITGDTAAFTNSSKKCFSPLCLGNQNYTEDLSKYRVGLLSAGSSSNSNIIIPMIPFIRPVSNFNFGGGKLWNNEYSHKNINNNINDKDKNKNEEQNINKFFNNVNNNVKENNSNEDYQKKILNTNINNIYTKINNGKRNKMFKSRDMKSEGFSKKSNNINNLYLGMNKMITKLHKIKIEKGMMDSGIVTSLNEKVKSNNDYQKKQIEQFKKSHSPMIFNCQNTKNTQILK